MSSTSACRAPRRLIGKDHHRIGTSARAIATRAAGRPTVSRRMAHPSPSPMSRRPLRREFAAFRAADAGINHGTATLSVADVRASKLNCWNTKPILRLRISASSSLDSPAVSTPSSNR